MTAHIHAELMDQYAQDAMETTKPWERWQISNSTQGWSDLDYHPRWSPIHQYRRKPKKKIMRAWVNLYPDGQVSTHYDPTIAQAWAKSNNRRVIECREITWEVEE